MRTLRSVRAQRGVDLRILVVDDGSSDGTARAVSGIRDPRITILRHDQPRGVSAARNAAIEVATTPWIAFVDDDDLWAPDKLRAQLCVLAATPEARWSCVSAVNFDWRDRRRLVVRAPSSGDIAPRLLAGMIVPGGGSGVLARTDLVRSIGGFDESLSNLADWDCYIRLALASPMASTSRPLLGYFAHPAAMSLNVRRSKDEYARISSKYAADRAKRGVQLDQWGWLMYLTRAAVLAGERRSAVQLCWKAFQLEPSMWNVARIAKRQSPVQLKALWQRVSERRTSDDPDSGFEWLDEARRFDPDTPSDRADRVDGTRIPRRPDSGAASVD